MITIAGYLYSLESQEIKENIILVQETDQSLPRN